MLPQESKFPRQSERRPAVVMPPIYVVPTWMKVLTGALCGVVAALIVAFVLMFMMVRETHAMWFVTAKEVATLKGETQ